jgi:hypothetical protein
MGFDEIAARALTDVFNHLGDPAVFTPSEGDPVECMVIMDRETGIEPGGYDAQVAVPVTTLEYMRDETDQEAKRGDTFTVAGDEWIVEGPFEDENSNDLYTGKVVVRK